MLRVIPTLLAASVLLGSCLVPGRTEAADASLLPQLTGHWRCTGSSGAVERSLRGTATGGEAEFFARGDEVLASGDTETSWEHAVRHPGETVLRAETPDGTGSADLGATALRITGSAYAGGTPIALTYALRDDGTLLRTFSSGAATDAETCIREPAPVAVTCAEPNVAATTLHAVQPYPTTEAYSQGVHGTVVLRLVLDDRSSVLWVDVIRSPSALLNENSVRAVRESTFRTAIRDCKPVAAEFVFTVEYSRR